MRVLVTGGSGFVGAHTVAALLRDGHRVRVLARQKQRVAAALSPLGASPDQVEVAEGDLTRPETIPPAIQGMDAVVHAASVFSYDPRDAAEIARVNLEGTRAVLSAAHAAGLDPIVHVSSLVALLPPTATTIGPDSPIGHGDPDLAPYSVSKAAQERWVRGLQATGAPVVSVLPGSVWGPHDPHDGESVQAVRNIVRHLFLVSVRGGLMVVDVRDVADVLAAVVAAGPGRGPRRYTAGGTWQTLPDLHRQIGSILGRRLVTYAAPRRVALAAGRGARWLQRRVGPRLPIGPEQALVVSTFVPSDDHRTTHELGVSFRPVDQTLRDHVAWQQSAGRL